MSHVDALRRLADVVEDLEEAAVDVARYHRESDMLVLARMGALVSTVPLSDRPADEQQYIRNQVTDK